MELVNKVAMITGGSTGLGAAIARRLSEEGAAVSICARGRHALRDTCKELEAMGARCVPFHADVRHEDDVGRWVEFTFNELGRIDALVNNASMLGSRVAIEDYDLEEWKHVIDVNLTGAFLCARAVVPFFKETGGSIINISSGVGDHGRPYWGAYCVSKNGLEAMSEMMAGELEGADVRVNAVDPGAMRTEMRAAAYPDEDPQTVPTPHEITDVFVYLVSDRSRGVTGQRFRAREFEAAQR
jgi:NAD(P)-dependent dehydrogenase (short-subunit alcohol dehydrogenase family)